MNTENYNLDYVDPEPPRREAWWKVTLKWIALLPGSIVAYYVATILNNWGASYYNPDIVHDMMGTGDFGGHYILGPIYIFHTRAIAAAAFVAFAVWLAPSHKKTVFGVYAAFTCCGSLPLFSSLAQPSTSLEDFDGSRSFG